MIFCVVSADVIIPPVVPVVNPVITVTQGCQWLICICGFFLFTFAFSFITSFGLYFVEWLEYFHSGKITASLVNGVGIFIMGPAG